jgi:hypothetical protein
MAIYGIFHLIGSLTLIVWGIFFLGNYVISSLLLFVFIVPDIIGVFISIAVIVYAFYIGEFWFGVIYLALWQTVPTIILLMGLGGALWAKIAGR